MELVVNSDEQINSGMMAGGRKSGRVNAADFDSAELRVGPPLGQGVFLIVSGPMPKPDVKIKLIPVLGDPYPEYRRIEVAWEAHAANDLDVLLDPNGSGGGERFERSMPLSGLSGTKGIELVGANGTKKFDLTGQ